LTRRALAVLFALVGSLAFASNAGASQSQTAYAWGDFGEDGHASPAVDTPTVVSGIPGTIKEVVATNSATYFLLTDETVWAIGANGLGELGQGDTSGYTTTPVHIPLPPIASLPADMPFATGLAIDTTGHVWGWGDNEGGDLCLDNKNDYLSPAQLPFTNVTLATGAGGHASYLSNAQLYSCGKGDYGQLGNGSFKGSTTAVPVSLSGVVGLYSSYADTAALLSDGTYWDWGNNLYGQLGDRSRSNSPVPVEVATHVATANVGGNDFQDGQTFVTLSNGTTETWGANAYGQLCLGNKKPVYAHPVVVTAPAGVTWTSWVSGGSTTYPIDSNGNLWACGDNETGEAGTGTMGGPIVTPTEILSGVTAVSSTSRNVVAVQ
jgi:alpha-tubulin suppressor-like RCC1 family protein